MSTNKFLMNRLKGRNNENFDRIIQLVAEENGVSETKVKLNFMKNFLKHRMGTFDYYFNDFYNLSEDEKKDVITISRYDNLLQYLNPFRYRGILEDKLVFNRVYEDYIKRDYLDLRIATAEDIRNFLNRQSKDYVFAKVTADFGGRGINKIKISDIDDVQALRDDCIKNGQYLLEEQMVQHEVFDQINPSAVNSVRVFTIRQKDRVEVLGAVIRITMNNEDVINLDYILSSIDASGYLNPIFVDNYGHRFDRHLQTGQKFADIPQIPYWDEAYDMVKAAAMEVPGNRFIGWDVTILEDGPALIEGNAYGDYALMQNRFLGEDHTKMLKRIREFLGDEYQNIHFD